MVPWYSSYLPLRQLWCHNLNSTYHFVSYGAMVFVLLTTSSVMVPQSSFHLPVFQLRCHNLHFTHHIFSHGTIIFCPCTSLSFVMQHSSLLVQRITFHYSNIKETGRGKCKLYNDTRIFSFASGIHRCPKIFAQPTLLCYVRQCVIFIAAKWRCKRTVQIGNSSNC